MLSTAIVATDHASTYIVQLCRHWAHKLTVNFNVEHAHIDFGSGRVARLDAGDGELRISVSDADPAGLPILEQVVEDHIKRFGFREDLRFDWVRARAEKPARTLH